MKLLTSLALTAALLTSSVYGETQVTKANYPVLCGNALEILSTLQNKRNEYPVAVWQSDDVLFVLMSNKDTKSVTLVLIPPNQDTTVCVLAVGENLSYLPGNSAKPGKPS